MKKNQVTLLYEKGTRKFDVPRAVATPALNRVFRRYAAHQRFMERTSYGWLGKRLEKVLLDLENRNAMFELVSVGEFLGKIGCSHMGRFFYEAAYRVQKKAKKRS